MGFLFISKVKFEQNVKADLNYQVLSYGAGNRKCHIQISNTTILVSTKPDIYNHTAKNKKVQNKCTNFLVKYSILVLMLIYFLFRL